MPPNLPQRGHFSSKEGLIKSTCPEWQGNFSPCEAKNRRNTGCISRFFNEAGRKIFRQDGHGDLFRASLTSLTAVTGRSRRPYRALRTAGVEATECYSRGFRRRVSTVSRSLKVFFQVTSLHYCRWRCLIWAYLTPAWFFCQAESFCGAAKNLSHFLTLFSQQTICPRIKNISILIWQSPAAAARQYQNPES